ncbi:MAG: VTT domain-containing protein [Oscillospiraceae bacterium]
MKKTDNPARTNRIRLIAIILYLAGVTALSVWLFPYIRALTTHEGREALLTLVKSYRTAGIFVYIAIQAAQVVVVLVPPVQIVGGMLYGWLLGTVFSFAGLVLGSAAVFALVRAVGYPLAEAFVTKKHMHKFKFLENEKKLVKILFFMYLIPGFPKDALAYVIPLTKITVRDYFCYVLPARLPAVLMSAVFGTNLGRGNLPAAAALFVATSAFAVTSVFYRDRVIGALRKQKEKVQKNIGKRLDKRAK